MANSDVVVVINPATGEQVADYPSDEGRVEEALELATTSFRGWRKTGFEERAGLLRKAGAILRERQEEFARLITVEMGKPIGQSRAEVEKCATACDYYADHAEGFLSPETVASDASDSFVRYDPLGPVLAIMPWNFPFWQVFRFAAPTVMAGNVGVLKHASNVPGCSLAIAEVFREAGFPEGVFQSLLVGSKTAGELVADHRIAAVTLTGSEGAGMAIGAAAGKAIKPSVLELGGSDPFVILDDADVERAVEAAVQARMINSGQSCIAAKRFIAQAGVYDAVVEGMKGRMAALTVGDPLDEATQVGPLAKADLVNDLFDQVRASVQNGAYIAQGGSAMDRPGYFYEPTLLADCSRSTAAMRLETFGPVAAVARVETVEEAVALANDSPFGLGASVWTSAERGRELAAEIEAGHVAVNGIVKSDPRLPFGGIKRSGYGRELAWPGIRAFVNVKTVWIA